jgi:hypothetical protein
MANDYKNYWNGSFVPTMNQLKNMTDAGYKFDADVLVSNTRKPRTNGGKELGN